MRVEAAHVAHGLWIGSHPGPGPGVRQAGFRSLCLCAMELQPPSRDYPGVRVFHAPMDDGDAIPLVYARPAAAWVVGEILSGRTTLVTCRQGRNRSGLVVSLALWMLTGQRGLACATRLLAARPSALTNSTFRAYVENLPSRRHV